MQEIQARHESQSPEKQIYRSFTGMRGMACLFVIITHCFPMGRIETLLWSGSCAVRFFLTLSAYLLMKRSLDDLQPNSQDQPQRFLGMLLVKYAIRRLFRIYPAFFVAVVIYKIQSYFGTSEYYGAKLSWFVLLLWKTDGHLWTIRVEMAFYFIMLPLILLVASEMMRLDYKVFQGRWFKVSIIFYLILTAGAVIVASCNSILFSSWFSYYIPGFWSGCVGGIISHYLKIYKVKIQFTTKTRVIMLEGLAYLVLIRIALSIPPITEEFLGVPIDKDSWWKSEAVVSTAFPILLLLFEIGESHCSLERFFSLPLLYFMGEVSYSTYLIHLMAVAFVYNDTSLKSLEGYSTSCFLAFLIGSLLYHFVEKPTFRASKYGIKLAELLLRTYPKYLLMKLDEQVQKYLIKQKKWNIHKLTNDTSANNDVLEEDL